MLSKEEALEYEKWLQGIARQQVRTPDVTPDMLKPKRHPASERFHALLKEMGDLHDKKQADYGRSNDPFANVRATEEWGQKAWVGALIRATDKMRRLQKVACGGTLLNEGARDSFMDLAVYAIIGLVLYDEETEKMKEHNLGP